MFRLLGALALALFLVGCQTTGQRVSAVQTPLPPAQVSAAVSTVQRATRGVCGYVPSRSTVVALARTFTSSDGSTAGMVAALAQGICTAIHSPEAYANLSRAKLLAGNGNSYSAGRNLSSWRGVTITGRWAK